MQSSDGIEVPFELIQWLGKHNSRLVTWFGDMALYELRKEVTCREILTELMTYLK